LSQDRGIRGGVDQTRVTQDESQVSVGGLLALDQVLKNTWLYLTILELRQLVRDGAQREAEIKGARPIFGSL
jgi:hypothetical protein